MMGYMSNHPNSVNSISGYVRIRSREQAIFGGAGGGANESVNQDNSIELSSPLHENTFNVNGHKKIKQMKGRLHTGKSSLQPSSTRPLNSVRSVDYP